MRAVHKTDKTRKSTDANVKKFLTVRQEGDRQVSYASVVAKFATTREEGRQLRSQESEILGGTPKWTLAVTHIFPGWLSSRSTTNKLGHDIL